MANRDNPSGFIPVKHPSGSIRNEVVTIADANTVIAVGEPLVQTTAGVYDRAGAGGPCDAIAAQAAAANTGGTILAWTDPEIVFRAQTDNGTGTLTLQTGINLDADFISGVPVNGISTTEIDESSGIANAALAFKIVGLYSSPDNTFGEFNSLLVKRNASHDRAGVAGI